MECVLGEESYSHGGGILTLTRYPYLAEVSLFIRNRYHQMKTP